MKRNLNFATWSLFIALNGWFLVESFGYFRQNPADLIYVGGIALLAGVCFSFYCLLPFGWRKRLRLMLYGLATSGSAFGGIWLAFMDWKIWGMLPPIPPVLTPSDKLVVLQGAALIFAVIPFMIVVCGVTAFRCGQQLFLTLKENESHTLQ